MIAHEHTPEKKMHVENVDAVVRFTRDGRLEPVRVIWKDGRVFDIDEIIEETNFGKSVRGTRRKTYKIRIGNHVTDLVLAHFCPPIAGMGPETYTFRVFTRA